MQVSTLGKTSGLPATMLLKAPVNSITFGMLSPVFHRGILRSTKPEYRSDPVQLLGSSRKNTLSAEIYFVSSASKGMYPPRGGSQGQKKVFPEENNLCGRKAGRFAAHS